MNPILDLMFVVTLLGSQEPSERVPVPVELPAERPALALGTQLQLYDVATLTGHRQLEDEALAIVEAADLLPAESALLRLERVARRLEEVRSTTNSLLASIREMISPALEEGIQRIELLGGGSLALVGTPAQHHWLEEFLQNARRFDGLIDVQAHIFVLEPGRLDQLSRVRSGEVLERDQVVTLLGALKLAEVDAVTSPRITAFPFQQASLSVVDQLAYIKDYKLVVLPDEDAEVADPVVDVVSSGVEMTIRGIPSLNDELNIFAQLQYSTLERPISTFETTLGASSHPVRIQLPEVTRVKLEGRFGLRPGQTLVLSTRDSAGESEVLALVQVRRVEARELSLPDAR